MACRTSVCGQESAPPRRSFVGEGMLRRFYAARAAEAVDAIGFMGKEFFRKIPFDALGPNAYIHRMVRNNPYKSSQEIVMAAVLLKGVATITSKGQTTLPKAVDRKSVV